MKKYLIDTNIAIFYMKGKFELETKFEKANPENCFISEITLAELKFGVEKSEVCSQLGLCPRNDCKLGPDYDFIHHAIPYIHPKDNVWRILLTLDLFILHLRAIAGIGERHQHVSGSGGVAQEL